MKKLIPYVLGLTGSAVGVLAAYTPDYTPADMPNVVTDTLGEAGVQFKIYMPLLILGFALVILIVPPSLVLFSE